MPPLTGVLGKKLINFLKHSSMSRNGTTGDPMKKFIILAIEEGVSSGHKGGAGSGSEQHGQCIHHHVIKT